MRRLGEKSMSGRGASRVLFALSAAALGSAALGAGCGDDTTPESAASTATATATSATTGVGTGGEGGSAGGGEGGAGGRGGGGGSQGPCIDLAPGPTRGSAIAVSPDDSRIVVVNRDTGSITVLSVDSIDNRPVMTQIAEIPVGGEPWQVALDACGRTAYVALRKDQKVVQILNIDTVPSKGLEVKVGSEPTGLALAPNNSALYVANWVDGTLSVIDAPTLQKKGEIDLNKPLVDTGMLGATAPRPALAHPRSIAITNDGDTDDTDEKVYVTEFFAQRALPESADGSNSDIAKQGLIYRVAIADGAVSTVNLPPIPDTGFKDSKGQITACFPNQLQSITINGAFAYVTSVCASPAGPLGVFQRAACSTDADCGDVAGACNVVSKKCECTAQNQDQVCGFGGTCAIPTGQPSGSCNPNVTNVRTTTHPAVHVIDTTTDTDAQTAATNLNKRFFDLYTSENAPDDASRRLPHIANDIAFVPATGAAYVTANGADAVFRVQVDPTTGGILEVGLPGYPRFIDLSPPDVMNSALRGRNPIGIAVAKKKPFGFIANDVSRNVTAIDLDKQIVAGTDLAVKDPRVVATSAQPADEAGQAFLRGKRFFNTGLNRWSQKGQGWGSCQACHSDGLTDNVTWYFARGPRQSTSLDGSFASGDPADQRIFNWTAVSDEIADFELNTRNVSGGVGALVTVNGNPPQESDQINLAAQGHAGLNGSTKEVTDTLSSLKDWNDITRYVQTIRSPRAPTNLDPAMVTEGKALFEAKGGCGGCHGGPKWTISTRFYTPSKSTNMALLTKTWDAAALTAAGFPDTLLPAITKANQVMRFYGGNAAAFDQILCVLRPVGTFNKAPMDVGIAELRSDMATVAQGNPAGGDGRGYNPPSLLNLAAGAPFFHAGSARTLEEAFASPATGGVFEEHFRSALAAADFLEQENGDREKLIAYLLSIDESATPVLVPAVGVGGGDFCAPP